MRWGSIDYENVGGSENETIEGRENEGVGGRGNTQMIVKQGKETHLFFMKVLHIQQQFSMKPSLLLHPKKILKMILYINVMISHLSHF